jgi:hypothetical protein
MQTKRFLYTSKLKKKLAIGMGNLRVPKDYTLYVLIPAVLLKDVSLTAQLNMRQGGPQSQDGRGGERKKIPSMPLPGIEFQSSSP